MSDYYKIRLSRFAGDTGATNGARPLTQVELDNIGITGQEFTGDPEGRFANQTGAVIFDVSPTISESRGNEYVDSALPGPVGIIVYAKTQNRRFNIESRFVSRNLEEAVINYRYTNLLRGWMIPQPFGDGNAESRLVLGRPPILRLNGYKKQFFNIPVVITDLSINYPEDVDYIETPDAIVPIIQSVTVNLTESHNVTVATANGSNRGLFGEFNLKDFKEGNLPGY